MDGLLTHWGSIGEEDLRQVSLRPGACGGPRPSGLPRGRSLTGTDAFQGGVRIEWGQLAAVGLLLVCLWREGSLRMRWRDVARVAVVGLFGVGVYVMLTIK